MATIIDSLVVQLGLDATAFKRGQREVNDSWQKARGTQLQHARAMEDGNKKLLESFNKLKVEALGFFAALLGAREVKEFIANITTATAAVGRLAVNLGIAPQELQAFGMAVQRMGGSSEDAAKTVDALSKSIYDLKYNGKGFPEATYRLFAMLGKSAPNQRDSVATIIKKEADALSSFAKQDRAGAFRFGQDMGWSDSAINLAIEKGDKLQEYLKSLEKFGATDEQIKNSKALIEEWNTLGDKAVAIGRDIANWFSEPFMKVMKEVESGFDAIYGVTHSISGADFSKFPSQIGMNEAALGGSPGVVATQGGEVSKSNPLPVQIVPNASGTGAGSSGQSWWDWLTGGSGGGATPAPSGSGKGPGPGDAARARLMGRLRGGAGGGTSGYYKGNQQDRIYALMDRLVTVHGWTPEAAAIAAGNAVQESNVMPNGANGDGGVSQGMFQWNGARLSALKAFAASRNANWRDFNTQADFFAAESQQRSGLEAGWKGVKDFSSAGALGHAYEGYGDNSEGARVRDAREALAIYNQRKAGGSASGGGYKTAGEWYDQGQTFGNTITGANAIGMYVNGVWVPRWAHMPGSPFNTGVRAPTGGASAAEVRADNAAGNRAHGWKPRSMYHPLWHGLNQAPVGVPGPGASLSTLHAVHGVTTSSTSNAMHIQSITVNAPHATDAHGIAANIFAALGSYQSSMGMQSGQV